MESYPHTRENYSKVILQLKERFGRDDMLVQIYYIKIYWTRWLSVGNGVLTLECNWEGLVSVLLEDKRPVAQGLLKQVTSFLLLTTTALMNDVNVFDKQI